MLAVSTRCSAGSDARVLFGRGHVPPAPPPEPDANNGWGCLVIVLAIALLLIVLVALFAEYADSARHD